LLLADGGSASATYASGTDLLTSFADQNGKTTNYSYNSAGDLTGITYDDGSGASYSTPAGIRRKPGAPIRH
jgi:YD repeat-containing protein